MGEPHGRVQKPKASSSRAVTIPESDGPRGGMGFQNQERESCAELGCLEGRKQPDQSHITGVEPGE